MTNTEQLPTTPALDADDPRATFGAAVATGTAVVAGVRPDQLDDPTPCEDMAVRDLLGHLVEVLERVAALGAGEDPFGVSAPDVPDAPDHADGGWLAAWQAAAHRVQAAWSDDAVLDRTMSLPWQQGPGRDVLAGYVSELTVHTWDLATATGQRPDWDERVVEVALAGSMLLPAEGRLALFEEVSRAMGLDEVAVPYAEAVTVADDAPAIDRLVAWTGRDPRR